MENNSVRCEQYKFLFWDRLQKGIEILVPEFLKDIFRFNYLDNAAISEITEDNISEIEDSKLINYAKNNPEFSRNIVVSSAKIKKKLQTHVNLSDEDVDSNKLKLKHLISEFLLLNKDNLNIAQESLMANVDINFS
ncbi:hypothetical protein ABEB36_014517 [Hypothenemus hampei]|uniref:Uncharacterized protein n=1 Tax=Hypothenemus hampei TaxID=57062 RepID=A0ABD1E226_HYPHA